MKEKEENLEQLEMCNGVSKPTQPGSTNPGNWDCQGSPKAWVWIEDIGGE